MELSQERPRVIDTEGEAPDPLLVVSESLGAHEDFVALRDANAGKAGAPGQPLNFTADFVTHRGAAYHVLRACEQQRPYAIAFLVMQAPATEEELENLSDIYQEDPEIQLVVCTSNPQALWPRIHRLLRNCNRITMLQQPFTVVELLQITQMLVDKWRQSRRLEHLEQALLDRTLDLEACNARLETAYRRLAAAAEQERDALKPPRRDRGVLEAEMRQALDRGEFFLEYQPLVEISSNRIKSLEALVRWKHPTRGLISPAAFIPAAEESGLILPLGEYILSAACEQVVRWEREQVPVVPVAVNISAVQLQRQKMWKFVRGVLKKTGMMPQLLALELTESSLIRDAQEHVRDLHGLRRDGVLIQIDDFGTGYSSLSYLKRLPIDTLKIDRSFISQLDVNQADEAIVSAILAMAHSLGLKVVAEGVETRAQLETLQKYGCEFAQGYFFSRPLPADSCRKLLCEAAQRPSFTDTLRLTWVTDQGNRHLVRSR